MPEQITTNYLIIETALAAYAVLEDHMLLSREKLPEGHPFKEADEMVTQWCENHGAAEMRRAAWSMAPAIETIWSGLTEEERDGQICWDFEFVPQLMLFCFDWDTHGYPSIPNEHNPAAVVVDFRTARENVAKFYAGRA